MKKFLTYSVVMATIAWSMGIAAVLPAAAAYSAVDGDVVKVAAKDRPAVYYISGGKKYLFVNRVTYSTWASAIGDSADKFAGLKAISQADFDAISTGGNITVRPGTGLVKFDDGAAVYAVGAGAKLYQLADSAAMSALYSGVTPIIIQSGFRANYYDNGNSVATLTATSKYPDGTLIKASTGDTYLLDGGNKRMVTTDAFTANGFKASNVRTVSDLTAYGTGSSVTAKEAASSPVSGTSAPVAGGALSVALSSATPAATTIVGDANGSQNLIPMLAVNLTASSAGDIKVTGMKFERTGISADDDILNTYVYEGNNKLAEGGSVSSKVLTFNAANGIVTIPAGQTKTVLLKMDAKVALAAGKTIGFNLIDITSNASSKAGLPVSGNLMSTALVNDLGYAVISGATSTPAAASTAVNAGEKDFIAKKITLTATDQDLQLEGLRVTQIGSVAADDLQNIKLTVGGTTLATATLNANSEAYFDLSASPYTISKGNSKTFNVLVDVVKGSTKTFSFSVQYATDLVVKDKSYGVYVGSYLSGSTSWTALKPETSAAVATNFLISSGSVSFTKDTTSPSGSVAGNSTNVKIATYRITATGEDVKVKSLNVTASTSVNSLAQTGLQNGKVYFDGVQVGSTKNLTEDTAINFTFGSSFIVPAGTTKLVDIYADMKSSTGTALTTGGIVVTVDSSDTQGMSSLSTGGNLNLASTAANILSLSAVSTITMSKYAAYGAQSLPSPSSNVKVGSFVISAPAAEGVTIDNLYVSGATSGDLDGGLTFKVGASTINTKTALPTSGTTTVTMGSSLTLAAGETKVVDIYSSIKSGLNAGHVVTLIVAADGTTPITNTSATAVGATLQAITVTAGSLSLDSTYAKPSSDIVVGGSTVTVNTAFFNASNESYTITNLTVTTTETAVTSSYAVAQSVARRAIGSVILEYKNKAGENVTATGNLDANGTVNFSNLAIWVPRNVGAAVTVKAVIATTESGAISGDKITFTVAPSDGTSSRFSATGDSSGTAIYDYTGATGSAGNAMVVRRSKPTVSLNTLPTSALVAGDNTLMRFSVAADAAGDITWKRIVFAVSTSSGLTLSNAYLYKTGDATPLNASAVTPTVSVSATGDRAIIAMVADNEQTITKGTSQSYDLVVNVGGVTTNSSVSSRILGSANAAVTGTSTTYAEVILTDTTGLAWSDRSGSTTNQLTAAAKDDGIHTSTSDDWCDAAYVKTTTSSSQTLTK